MLDMSIKQILRTIRSAVLGFCGECRITKDYLEKQESSVHILAIRALDAVLRGVSQVVFVSNPISGLLILIGIFLAAWEIGVGTLACTVAAYFSALYFRQPKGVLQDGLTQFNGVLVGSVVFSLYPVLYGGHYDLRMWIITLLGVVLSVPVVVAVAGFLNGVSAKFLTMKSRHVREYVAYGVPGFTLPFNITASLVMALLYKEPETILNGVLPLFLNETIKYDQVMIGAVKSMGQVYAVDTLIGSIMMYIAVAIYSPMLAAVQFFGAFTASMTAVHLDSGHIEDVYAGIWGYCSILTAGAVGGYFAVLTPKSSPLVILAIATTVAAQKLLIPFMQIGHLPVFTLPFVLSSWLFLLTTTENTILYRTVNPTVPEINFKLWMKETGVSLDCRKKKKEACAVENGNYK